MNKSTRPNITCLLYNKNYHLLKGPAVYQPDFLIEQEKAA